MKRGTYHISFALAIELASFYSFAQTAHRIESIRPASGGVMLLTMTGSVPQPFTPYFDIYLLDASTNLEHWTPLPPLLRTNALSVPLFRDDEARNHAARFYRMATNHLITSFPAPTGPCRVGMISRLMTDPSRTNRYGIPTNSSFMISIWYPAQATAGAPPGPWLDPQVATHVMRSRYFNQVRYLVSHSLPGVAVATNDIAYPVLFYSIRLGGGR